MLPFNAQAGSSAPQNAQHVGSANGSTLQQPEGASSGAGGSSGQTRHRRVRSDYRCHSLSLEREALLVESKEITQQYIDGVINISEFRELFARCKAKRHAVLQAIEEEWDAEEPTTAEVLQDWGYDYTEEEVKRVNRDIFNYTSLRACNQSRSNKYFPYRRQLAGRH
ncbi:hypothetical protein EVG20_g987 [Dentipellis fragilis]|uniref:Uncharacterized protein n=1 Tax=Dentipellis fragilis TaxID=205917 RepID=A0A4Y9ZB27_9AGAM|nr:hypothetical protein EVG20_g987 [Dentipellis fragilis]